MKSVYHSLVFNNYVYHMISYLLQDMTVSSASESWRFGSVVERSLGSYSPHIYFHNNRLSGTPLEKTKVVCLAKSFFMASKAYHAHSHTIQRKSCQRTRGKTVGGRMRELVGPEQFIPVMGVR